MYLRKSDNKVILEIYSDEFCPVLEARLTANGFSFRTEKFFNSFWGTRFVVDRPKGKGSVAKMNFLDTVCR
jgi:hypothetical protein